MWHWSPAAGLLCMAHKGCDYCGWGHILQIMALPRNFLSQMWIRATVCPCFIACFMSGCVAPHRQCWEMTPDYREAMHTWPGQETIDQDSERRKKTQVRQGKADKKGKLIDWARGGPQLGCVLGHQRSPSKFKMNGQRDLNEKMLPARYLETAQLFGN